MFAETFVRKLYERSEKKTHTHQCSQSIQWNKLDDGVGNCSEVKVKKEIKLYLNRTYNSNKKKFNLTLILFVSLRQVTQSPKMAHKEIGKIKSDVLFTFNIEKNNINSMECTVQSFFLL